MLKSSSRVSDKGVSEHSVRRRDEIWITPIIGLPLILF